MTVAPASRQQAADFAARVRELRASLQSAQSVLDNARTEFGGGGGSPQALAEAANARDRIAAQLNELDHAQRSLVDGMADGIIGGHGAGSQSFAALFDAENHVDELRSSGILKELASGGSISGRVKLGEISGERVAEMFGDRIQGIQAAGGIVTPPGNIAVSPVAMIVPLLLAPTPFLTLFPAQTTDHRTIEYQQRKVVAGGSKPAPTSPGATKPAVDLEYDAATCGTETIAGWAKLNKQDVDDETLLLDTVKSDVMNEVWLATDNEVVNGLGTVGDGAAGGILGLLKQPDVTVADVTGDTTIGDKLLSGLRDVSLLHAVPNFVALNPTDLSRLAKTKTTTAGDYSLSQLTALVAKLYPNVQWVTAPGLPTGTAMAGDTLRAATLLIRSGMSVYVGMESDDLVPPENPGERVRDGESGRFRGGPAGL